MYLDPVKEPVSHHAKMPVKSNHNEDVLSGDLPNDTAWGPWDPPIKDDVIKRSAAPIKRSSTPTKRSSTPTKMWTPTFRKRRYRSTNLSPISDSDSDDELVSVSQNQERKHMIESREDVSSPNEVANILNDRGSKALQENACLRKSHSRIASPHRNPLQVTQEQAKISSNKRWGDFDSSVSSKPKKFKIEAKKIKSYEQNLKPSPRKVESLLLEPPTLDLVKPTQTQRELLTG